MIYSNSQLFNIKGYSFKGMLGISPGIANYIQTILNHQVYEILDNNTESAIEDQIIKPQPNDNRIFGVEFKDLSKDDLVAILQQWNTYSANFLQSTYLKFIVHRKGVHYVCISNN